MFFRKIAFLGKLTIWVFESSAEHKLSYSVEVKNPSIVLFVFRQGNFFRWAHPSHDDYGKTIGDIEQRFFAFNCQLKKLNGETFSFSSDYQFTGNRRSFI
jgi:hypothetical protein